MSVRFDDPNLVSCAGLGAVLALAVRCGLATLVADRIRITAKGGVNATAKIMTLVAGMVAGADSITDMDLLRHGGMDRLCTDVRAPSTLGTFCACSPSATSVSSTRSPPGSWPGWSRPPRS
jgi:hypothetical protein